MIKELIQKEKYIKLNRKNSNNKEIHRIKKK